MTTTRNRIRLLEMAQEKLNEVIQMLEIATKGDRNTEAYLLDHLKIFASNDHNFLSDNLNFDKVIQHYREDDIYFEEDIDEN